MNHKNIWNRMGLLLALLALFMLGLTPVTEAADFRGGETVIIEAGEVIDDDLFVSGGRIEVNGTVKGDLFASGSEVTVNGAVEGSLMVAGQTLQVNGPVGGSVYGGGYTLILGPEAQINRNLYFGGFSLTTEAGSTVGRGLHAANYQSLLNGDVAHDVSVAAGALELNGSVGGDLTAEIDAAGGQAPFMPPFQGSIQPVAPGFRQAESARVAGSTTITEMADGQAGAAEQTGPLGMSQAASRRVGEFIALLIVGGLLLYVGPSLIRRSSDQLEAQPLSSIGWGLLIFLIFVVGVPILFLMLALLTIIFSLITFGQLTTGIVTVGGVLLALLVVAFAVTLALITKIIVAYLGGRLILARLAPQMTSGFGRDFVALVIGMVIYELVRAIPFGFGWLIGVLVTLIGLGAFYFMLRDSRGSLSLHRPTAPEAAG